MTASVDSLLTQARRRIERVGPDELDDVMAGGGIVVDIRPQELRLAQGSLPGAVVVERNVLEWRLDPQGEHRLPEVRDYAQRIIVVCAEGYASSLAAASLADLGFEHVGDLIGGYLAWANWSARSGRT